jgi:xanthine dehydrogenase large subunit
MGQGVNARIAHLVSEEFGIRRHDVRVMATQTDKNPNTSPTAASSGTDINGAAAVLAARKIKERLSFVAAQILKLPESRWAKHTAGLGTELEIETPSPVSHPHDPNADAEWKTGIATYYGIAFKNGYVFDERNPAEKVSFEAVVNEAYLNRISLADHAHYRIPDLSFNKLTGKGNAFLYFTQGTACNEVSIDRDTGEVKVLRTDILMDLGRPINYGLDTGQVVGGFIQGMGWVTNEKLFYDQGGALLSHAPSTYKIPSVQDTPRVFNIEILENDQNKVGLRGMKAIGEPPLLLALGVWTAIHDALKKLPHYQDEYPVMELPATGEEILRAMQPELFESFAVKQ